MRVLIVPNTVNPAACTAAVELAAWCAGHGIDAVLESSDARAVGLDDAGVPAVDLCDLSLVVALGGDGTILKAVHLLGDRDVPVLGVKYGRLGFLSGARPDTMREAVTAALAGDVVHERRATLDIEVIMEGRIVGRYRALNEVAVSRGTSGRVVAFDLRVNGHEVLKTHADSMIAATSTGSTAYAMSAGGPVVDPSVRGMVVTPVAPHTLAARALVTGPSSVVEINLPDPVRADVCLIIDGDVKPCRQRLEKVIVTVSPHDVNLVKSEGRDFYETVAAEFFGGGR